MTNVLFTYRRRVTLGDGGVVENDNFLNPFNVVSFFWELATDKETGEIIDPRRKVLNVFLVNSKSIIFAESIGVKFQQHMEDFLRYTLFGPTAQESIHIPQRNTHNGPRKRNRTAIDAEMVDEDVSTTTETAWVQN